MRYLYPSGGELPAGFAGYLVSYKTKGIPEAIRNGAAWAGDNCSFSGFDALAFSLWLDLMQPYRATCLFVVVPDVVGNAVETLKLWGEWAREINYPLAYVAQDGAENLLIPDNCSAVFIGGSTEWKMSNRAIDVIGRAVGLGKRVHVGRVNYFRRYQHFAGLTGADGFTCDGTRLRFERDKAIAAWSEYHDRAKQTNIFDWTLPDGDYSGKPIERPFWP